MPTTRESGGSKRRERAAQWLALRLALIYAVAAGLWILLSDRALGWLNLPRDVALRLASVKGMGFVAVTAALLFVLALGFIRRIQASREQYEHLFENAVEGLMVFRVQRAAGSADLGSADLELVDLNPVAERRTGLGRDTVAGLRLCGLDGVGERTRAYFHLMAEAVESGGLTRREFHDGQDDAYELLEAYPIGRDRWALATEDITERKVAEQELRRSRQQYVTFINATDDMAYVKDADLRYVIVNPANAAFFGRGADEIVGLTDAELQSPIGAANCVASDARALESGRVVISEEEVSGRVYETRKFAVELDDGKTGVGGYVRDVTESRHGEDEIRLLAAGLELRVEQRTAQLEATNRELESFAYSISHDLRSPLRALDGFSEILLQDYGEKLDDAGRNHLRRIKGAANHMAGLMDGLLQLSRLNREELAFREVDLGAMAVSTIAELREQDPRRDVVVDIEPDLVAQADPKLMRSVLANLLGNAWKFTSRHDHAHIEVGAAETDRGRAFFVKDDGAGFDMRYAENLFGAFQRLHTPDQFEGTGIGLATVQRIVHRHGGAVWAEGEVEKGATFWFTLEATDPG